METIEKAAWEKQKDFDTSQLLHNARKQKNIEYYPVYPATSVSVRLLMLASQSGFK